MLERHFCTSKCPDCKSICQREIDHEGEHKTVHRNQESLIYVAESTDAKILVKGADDKEKTEFLFEVGDLSTPTTCL